ncbi:MAG: hypothetical protein J0G32_07755 [Alphaproteobacteria bacterium]|nr:hypothetical protein [Alphaproteobacteria bacterium]OJV12252.1 MAG: hypothetical protein BGO27_05910 [Alphaproteobacteria bacterium 33-17]
MLKKIYILIERVDDSYTTGGERGLNSNYLEKSKNAKESLLELCDLYIMLNQELQKTLIKTSGNILLKIACECNNVALANMIVQDAQNFGIEIAAVGYDWKEIIKFTLTNAAYSDMGIWLLNNSKNINLPLNNLHQSDWKDIWRNLTLRGHSYEITAYIYNNREVLNIDFDTIYQNGIKIDEFLDICKYQKDIRFLDLLWNICDNKINANSNIKALGDTFKQYISAYQYSSSAHIEWLYNKCKSLNMNITKMLESIDIVIVVKFDSLETLKTIHTLNTNENLYNNVNFANNFFSRAFYKACQENHYEKAKFLYQNFKALNGKIYKLFVNFDDNYYGEMAFNNSIGIIIFLKSIPEFKCNISKMMQCFSGVDKATHVLSMLNIYDEIAKEIGYDCSLLFEKLCDHNFSIRLQNFLEVCQDTKKQMLQHKHTIQILCSQNDSPTLNDLRNILGYAHVLEKMYKNEAFKNGIESLPNEIGEIITEKLGLKLKGSFRALINEADSLSRSK